MLCPHRVQLNVMSISSRLQLVVACCRSLQFDSFHRKAQQVVIGGDSSTIVKALAISISYPQSASGYSLALQCIPSKGVIHHINVISKTFIFHHKQVALNPGYSSKHTGSGVPIKRLIHRVHLIEVLVKSIQARSRPLLLLTQKWLYPPKVIQLVADFPQVLRSEFS